MSIALIISTTTQDGRRDDVHQLWLEHLAEAASSNDSQTTVVWCDDQEDANTFHLFEIYSDEESFGANAQSAAFATYMANVMPLLADEPVIRTGTPRWQKGAG